MKNSIFICCILIILFKTGNVLSDNNIFNVNNIEIDKKISQNKEKTTNLAFHRDSWNIRYLRDITEGAKMVQNLVVPNHIKPTTL